MTTQAPPSPEITDPRILQKIRAALCNPRIIADFATRHDPQGKLGDEAWLWAIAQVLKAGLVCNRIKDSPLEELWHQTVEAPKGKTIELGTSSNPYGVSPKPDVLVLSEDDSSDTLRPFLREYANFEGHDGTGKRVAWTNVRTVKNNLRLWFIDQANDHNTTWAFLIFPTETTNSGVMPGITWRDGQTDFEAAMKKWEKNGGWDIPRDQFVPPSDEAGSKPDPALGPIQDLRFVAWIRRTKGKLKKIRQMTEEEVRAEKKKP